MHPPARNQKLGHISYAALVLGVDAFGRFHERQAPPIGPDELTLVSVYRHRLEANRRR
jgi:hypothetical protein